MKPTYRKSWAGNLLMFSDLTLGPSFKVKRWFTGFDELSFWWIQICNGSPMRRSSFTSLLVTINKPKTCDKCINLLNKTAEHISNGYSDIYTER